MIVQELSEKYPVTQLCEVLGVPRSSYYYQAAATDETKLKSEIERLCGEWPTYGYRRISRQLQRESKEVVNDKVVRRLMNELGLQIKRKARKRQTTDSNHACPRYPNLVLELEIDRPDQVWVSDITYIRLGNDFVYLAIVMDVFTRVIRGWHLGRSLHQELTLTAFTKAIASGHTPTIHHSDQGVQYAAADYITLLTTHNITISMAEVGAAWQNGFAERFMRTLKEEEVALSDYRDFNDALNQIARFIDDVYLHKRIHSALGYLTPIEFERHWQHAR